MRTPLSLTKVSLKSTRWASTRRPRTSISTQLKSFEEGSTPKRRYTNADFRMTFARLCAHYFSHAAWLDSGQLLRKADRLAGIPGDLVHVRFDLGGPPDVPWLLARAWPDAELRFVRTGHVGGGTEMMDALIGAIDRFAARH